MGYCTSGLLTLAEPIHVTLYLLSKLQAGHTVPTVDASFYAIKFFYMSLLNLDSFRHFFFINVFEGAKRATAHKIKKKKTVSLDNLNKNFFKLNQNRPL